ncbi:hypothetical protein HDU99_001613, partial [Rhizoclosmatium hyalinum]
MVNWFAPVIVALSDAVALWELSPDTSHATDHMQTVLHSSMGISPPVEPRASVLTPNQPLHRWRDPSYHPHADAAAKITIVEVQLSANHKSNADMVALVAAAIASRTATAPLERIKVMLQTGAFSEPTKGLRYGERPLRLGLG